MYNTIALSVHSARYLIRYLEMLWNLHSATCEHCDMLAQVPVVAQVPVQYCTVRGRG
jgi:hypothetical protein